MMWRATVLHHVTIRPAAARARIAVTSDGDVFLSRPLARQFAPRVLRTILPRRKKTSARNMRALARPSNLELRIRARFLQNAKECRDLAARMTRKEDREILTDIAYQWEKLAALRQHDLIDVADSIASKPHEYNQLNFPIDKPNLP
jgi:hypothetical protein